MPIYLAHGFRWPRDGFTGIRVHAIIHNLEECSVEYIQNDHSRASILSSFRKQYPEIMKTLESGGCRIDFIEQYDPEDESPKTAVSQPYAFVCDRITMIAGGMNAMHHASNLLQNQKEGGRTSPASHRPSKERRKTPPMSLAAPYNTPAGITALSANVEDVIAEGSGFSSEHWEALADLRDKVAESEKIGWWVVYNGDPDRDFDDEGLEDVEEGEEEQVVERKTSSPTGGRLPPPVPPPKEKAPESFQASSELAPRTSLPMRETQESLNKEQIRNEPIRKDKELPEPSKSKDTAKAQGLRQKFFGKKSH